MASLVRESSVRCLQLIIYLCLVLQIALACVNGLLLLHVVWVVSLIRSLREHIVSTKHRVDWIVVHDPRGLRLWEHINVLNKVLVVKNQLSKMEVWHILLVLFCVHMHLVIFVTLHVTVPTSNLLQALVEIFV